MTWRVARSLDVLLNQLNAAYPRRSRLSDGSIGDTNHLAEGWDQSDHNPWYPKPNGGIVTARDYTHDPANGVDIDRFSDELAASRDPRIKYIIANRYILDSRPQFNPWKWMPYGGSNPHDHHLHLSVMDNVLCDDTRPWQIPMLGSTHPPAPGPGPIPASDWTSLPSIEYGNTGEPVKRAQTWFNKMFPAYSKLVVDGAYGDATTAVVKEFQRRSGIVGGDGRNVGPQTKQAMWRFGYRG
jgi:hypothetical protein